MIPGSEKPFAGSLGYGVDVDGMHHLCTRDGSPLPYTLHGAGHPLIFVSAYGMTAAEWPKRMLSPLADRYRLVLYDHRGISGCANPAVPFSIPQAAEDLHDLIAGIGEATATIIGYSMGGMVALEHAIRYPDEVDRLILLNAHCGGVEAVPSEEWVQEEMAGEPDSIDAYLDRAGRLLLTDSFRKMHPDPSLWFPDVGEPVDAAVVRQQFDALRSWSGVYPRLKDVRAKALVIFGDRDLVTPPDNAGILAMAIPDAGAIIMEDGGHGIIFQYPEEIAWMIREFLEQGDHPMGR